MSLTFSGSAHGIPSAINDRRQIVGNAYIEDSDGVVHTRACLLTPIAPVQ